MKNKTSLLALILMMFLSGAIYSENITIFVHGKSSNNFCNPDDTKDLVVGSTTNYWGTMTNTVSGKKFFVGYDGTSDPRTYGSCRAQTVLSKVLATRCKGVDTCKIVCHSAGCYASEYWLSSLGSATVSSIGYKISGVTALAAASGGSELASALNAISFGYGGNAMDQALRVTNARSSFNHNLTGGLNVAHVPGSKGLVGASAILPGEDDFAVAYHSACGMNEASGFSKCQSSITQYEGVWPFGGNKTYLQYAGHSRAPSVPVEGLYKNHSELCDDGWR
jgi:hypothetical protein